MFGGNQAPRTDERCFVLPKPGNVAMTRRPCGLPPLGSCALYSVGLLLTIVPNAMQCVAVMSGAKSSCRLPQHVGDRTFSTHWGNNSTSLVRHSTPKACVTKARLSLRASPRQRLDQPMHARDYRHWHSRQAISSVVIDLG